MSTSECGRSEVFNQYVQQTIDMAIIYTCNIPIIDSLKPGAQESQLEEPVSLAKCPGVH